MSDNDNNFGFLIRIVAVAALGGFLFGFDTAVINGAVPVLRAMFTEPGSTFAAGFEASQVDLIVGQSVAIALIGAAIGAFTAGPLTNRIGRKPAMVIASIAFLASAIGSGAPFTIIDFTFWRFLGGLAFGAASVIAPAYIAEVSPAHLRGRLGSMQQLAIVVGIFVALMSNLIIAQIAGSASAEWIGGFAAWQWMFWIEAIPAALYGILALGIPESPRYLVIKDRDDEARGVLSKVLGAQAADAKISEIRGTLSSEHKPRLSDILGPGLFKKIVWLGIGLSVFQQFVGINVVFYYSNLLWESVGLSEDQAFINTAIGGATNVLTTFIAIALVDKIGRKPLLAFGSIGMAMSLGVMAFVFNAAPLNPDKINLTVPAEVAGQYTITVETRGETGVIETVQMPITIDPLDPDAQPSETKTVTLDFRPVLGESRGTTEVELRDLPPGATIIDPAAKEGDITVTAGGIVTKRFTLKPDLTGDQRTMGIITLIALNLFIISFGASWGPIVWVMLGEMFSNQIRGAGLAVAASAQWGANYLISATFPLMASASLAFAYGFYSVSAVISLIFVLLLIPETKGKELESMGELGTKG
ncbi:MAG: sugar porter family MFS transporter [Planctomycetota bacterium]